MEKPTAIWLSDSNHSRLWLSALCLFVSEWNEETESEIIKHCCRRWLVRARTPAYLLAYWRRDCRAYRRKVMRCDAVGGYAAAKTWLDSLRSQSPYGTSPGQTVAAARPRWRARRLLPLREAEDRASRRRPTSPVRCWPLPRGRLLWLPRSSASAFNPPVSLITAIVTSVT